MKGSDKEDDCEEGEEEEKEKQEEEAKRVEYNNAVQSFRRKKNKQNVVFQCKEHTKVNEAINCTLTLQ